MSITAHKITCLALLDDVDTSLNVDFSLTRVETQTMRLPESVVNVAKSCKLPWAEELLLSAMFATQCPT